MKKYYKSILIVAGICIVFYAIFSVNRIVSQQIHGLTGKSAQTVELVQDISGSGRDLNTTQRKILRIEQKFPNEDYTESVVLVNKREVARYKAKNDKTFDESGHVPDGKVKFVNEWKNTYGFEHYRNGKRNGAFIELYNNGNIKTEAEYKRGRLLKRKTYYHSKVLMMEENFNATRFVSQLQSFNKFDKVGKGKFYRQDGSLKLEWSVVDGSDQHYTKRYTEAGELTEAHYYDDQGELIEHWTPLQEIPLKAAQMEPVEGQN